VELPRESASDKANPGQEAESRDSMERIWQRARTCLKAAEFEVLWLRFGEDLSVQETATATGRSLSSIKTLLHRARQRLLTTKETLR